MKTIRRDDTSYLLCPTRDLLQSPVQLGHPFPRVPFPIFSLGESFCKRALSATSEIYVPRIMQKQQSLTRSIGVYGPRGAPVPLSNEPSLVHQRQYRHLPSSSQQLVACSYLYRYVYVYFHPMQNVQHTLYSTLWARCTPRGWRMRV